MMKHFTLTLMSLMFGCFAHAGYLAVGESGEIIPEGTYRAGVAPQFVLNEGGGMNIDAFLDSGFNDSSSFRFQAGAGKVDFHMGAAVKYIPFPDVDQQPAIGVKASAWYARYLSNNIFTVQVAPLISRKCEIEEGQLVPYVAVPFNFNSGTNNNNTGTQFTFGTEFNKPEWPQVVFDAELALNMNHSFSTLTFSAAFPFDTETGFKRSK